MNNELIEKIKLRTNRFDNLGVCEHAMLYLESYERFLKWYDIKEPEFFEEKIDYTEEHEYAKKIAQEKYKVFNEPHIADVAREEKHLEERGFLWYSFGELIHMMDNEPAIIPIATGFEELDKALGGGLYEGIYTLSAITGIGKTTFLLNVAKNICKRDRKVLFFSLEMPKEYIRNTLLSMVSYEEHSLNRKLRAAPGKYMSLAKRNEVEMLRNSMDDVYDDNYERRYKLKNNMLIFNVKQGSVENLIESVKKFMNFNPKEKRPVIMIDYVQKLNTEEHVKDDRTRIDICMDKIAELSKNYGLTVLQISSVGRSRYLDNMSIGGGIESDSIEYESTAVIGLDYGLETDSENESQAETKLLKDSNEDDKDICLRISKNRNGSLVGKIRLKYHSKYGYFEEVLG